LLSQTGCLNVTNAASKIIADGAGPGGPLFLGPSAAQEATPNPPSQAVDHEVTLPDAVSQSTSTSEGVRVLAGNNSPLKTQPQVSDPAVAPPVPGVACDTGEDSSSYRNMLLHDRSMSMSTSPRKVSEGGLQNGGRDALVIVFSCPPLSQLVKLRQLEE
jgi:hypothetical protein